MFSYTRAFGDGPRHFEPMSSEHLSWHPPLLTTTPHQREDVSALDRFSVHRSPTGRVFSGTGLELVTKSATIRYLYHSAIAVTIVMWKAELKINELTANLISEDLDGSFLGITMCSRPPSPRTCIATINTIRCTT
ncbi:uncharacterized protein TNCV_484181 [Trichonephila clavipes]|nr:uncharacterized protein TNCV_484181 [Trichonephila clavipes]